MSIQILPPQLANQIAAGEVVERPASVVKELVENCLDAGATRVDIEIDKGGAKLIRVRDNGSGIDKESLSLALARHATSKVTTLDDLEAIMSFGFRGEALASISSVSRLTITSRTEFQTEAWQAYAEGSQMAVKVIPAAHPIGTTIEAVDLFFNTPARRRFLKSDKTEFTHIDEWLKRIAIVRRDIHFTLQHNGKMVRNYRPANTQAQYLQRLAQISNKNFAEQAIQINCEHDGLKLTGYLQSPYQPSITLNTHYFYVNGRLVRDRLVNHAVRQAFSELSDQEQPNYVLMLDLDPHQVDVNVHPAKHEVRFHQSRYVHDFILQALQSALSQLPQGDGLSSVFDDEFVENNDTHESGSGQDPFSTSAPAPVFSEQQPSYSNSDYRSNVVSRGASRDFQPRESINANAVKNYAELLSATNSEVNESNTVAVATMPTLLQGEYWVITDSESIKLLSVKKVALFTTEKKVKEKIATGLLPQPLLMPVSVTVQSQWKDVLNEKKVLLKQIGLEITIKLQQLIIKKVPSYLRDCQLAKVIPSLLQWIEHQDPTEDELAAWVTEQSLSGFISAPQVWQEYCELEDVKKESLLKFAITLPWQRWVDEQNMRDVV
ncbi:DNA mismatch repair endonuclease MutL [Parashewanella spongiae]|uniref:DNA mismatch repair protein MutL n=1 Tax=Parashewanella spongiae TaxID=342950 RepID=A0A3A6UBL4_9GAMM|nr:DNA mismatch repair endonuclease MutL [Parashewanella spongiae]MCL1077397.1 DNA mismatch repair endonuclease MutL [Parashewanella spongiae]RJY18978.1 DNA mismatch repair endonuclease MutL [Parashewanella spongiae]